MTEKMYSDIFSKKMPPEFFEGLNFVGGNSFRIDLELTGQNRDKVGKSVPFYEKEERLVFILERYGCAWQEDADEEDKTSNGNSGGLGDKKSRTNVSQIPW